MNEEYNFPEAQKEFLNILKKLKNPDSIIQLTSWISKNWNADLDIKSISSDYDNILDAIARDLREDLPLNGIHPSESTILARNKLDRHTVHIDAFLYDDELIDQLCEKGKLSRNYCLDCGSHKTKPLTFISHSISRNRINYIFKVLLPPLENKTILDIGSRIGVVLYGALLNTSNCKIIGIEMNNELCELQRNIIKKYKFQKNIKIIEADIKSKPDIVHSSDIIIMNNVFEYFIDRDSENTIWKYLKSTIKKKTLLITIPPLEETFSSIECDIELKSWVKELTPYNIEAAEIEDIENELNEVKLYEIL